MSLFEVLFHLVGPRELLLTYGTWKDLSGSALVVKEGMPLEAVLVLEVLGDLNPLTLDTSICAVGC
jgi:hypothetical protein